MINAIIAGHLGDANKLAAVGIGNCTNNVIIFSIMLGLNAAIDTLNSTAFGDGDLKLCGSYLNRGRVILTTFFIPPALIVFFFGE